MHRRAPIRWIRDCAVWLSHPYREYDRRRNIRLPAEVEVSVAVALFTLQGRTRNLSRGGASILLPEPIAPGTEVFLRFPTIDRSAFAHVRRCTAGEEHYEIALQFRDGLMLDDRTMEGFAYHRISAAGSWNDPVL